MNHSDLDNIDIKQELEFNDGVGDILTQKDHYKFSWRKTILVLSIGLIGVIMLTFGILELGKAIINVDKPMVAENEIKRPLVEVMEEVNNDTWNTLPEDSNEVIYEEIIPKKQVVKASVPKKKPAPKPVKVKRNTVRAVAKPVTPVIVKKAPVVPPTKKVVKKSQPVKKPVSASNKKIMYRVIAGSFSTYTNANKELKRVKSLGFDGYIWSLKSRSNQMSYKVQVGAFSSRQSAQVLVGKLKKKNISSFISWHYRN